MFLVYILKSLITARYYIGHTSDLNKRLKAHNFGNVKSTKGYKPWEVIYTEKFETKSEAFKREMQLKSYKSGQALNRIIGNK
ncbi:MAG TPA: GIY-YIG nuclease family protein [Ignavibacteriaceae bacterium]|nr:GIY-YIG nuclease family protein [Ignavibacteriaceae bacterium]